MQTEASTESRLQKDSVESPEDDVAVARWENEGGATSDPTRHPSFFSVMFNWFRTPARPQTRSMTQVRESFPRVKK